MLRKSCRTQHDHVIAVVSPGAPEPNSDLVKELAFISLMGAMALWGPMGGTTQHNDTDGTETLKINIF